ncbi:MAG TPA: AMP-binding protein [Candidatus Anaerobiospirillum pullistercoris]|uniref:AMP-binding protein n=1 Tax=Candidatus Anaerobiospirillum pullistercoris TaxID=2838452 RepID=A0A9D1WE35_9GAMM|nr:AMP-binding protein [Candidatus Anaerobiospirillum pullistercoris]
MTVHYQYNIDDYLRCSAQQWPNKVAVVDHNGTRTTTFAQLNEFAERLGSHLITLGLEREPILVLMPRSMEVAGCFAGITKSNNFYAHFDEDVPQERLVKTLHTFDPKVIIVRKDSSLLASISEHYSTTGTSLPILLNVEDIPTYSVDQKLLSLRRESHIDTDLLYVLFTSGSTGEPKGVTICHKSVIDYTEWLSSEFGFSEKTVFLNQAPFYFDNSITDIYSTFKAGSTLHLIDSLWYAMPAKVMKYMSEHHVTTIFWVPSVLCFFANTNAVERFAAQLQDLKQIIFCGEPMPNKQLNVWRKHLPQCTCTNLYGPTEITDVCAYYHAEREFADDEILPIGFACANTQLLLFAPEENSASGKTQYRFITPEQVGAKGLLFVRGTSLSLGYYANQAKTDAVFIQNPLHHNYLDRLYNTGDIVAYNEHGELVCYGRADSQIKYQGHRIELGEIEAIVSGHSEVKGCACVFDKQIGLFYTADHDLDLKAYLKDKLPSYMIPRHITRLDQFGSTANGKIDRFALKTKLKELGSGT